MKKKKVISLLLVAAMTAGLAAGCGSSSDSGDSGSSEAEGKVYYLNFKPEADDYWQELAEVYTEETGVEVTVLTAASGEYEKTLKSEMAKTDAPTLFQVNGPVGLASWKDYCYDLSDSDIAGELTDDSFALMDGDKMAGIAYVIENYGIIYNKDLLEKAGYTAEDITDFDSFKKVVEDITARKDELGFSAFTSAGMDSSSDWRFKTHLANLPIYYEYKDEGCLLYTSCMEQMEQEARYESWEKLLVKDGTSFQQVVVQNYVRDRLPEEKVEEVFRTLGDMPGNEERFITVYADIDVAYKITDYLDYEAARFSLLKRLEEELESRYFCWRADGEETGSAFIVRTTDKEAVGKLKHFLEYIKKEEQSRVIAAISKPYKGIAGIKRSYVEARKLFEIASVSGACLLYTSRTGMLHMESRRKMCGSDQYKGKA